MKKTYIKGKITIKKLKTVKLRKPSLDSYNELAEVNILAYPGCGHSCQSSDRRLKKNIKKLDSIMPQFKKITPVRFDWNANFVKTKKRKTNIGLIAQDFETIFPEFVYEGEDGYKRIEYDKITTILISAVQELTQRVEELEKKR